MRRHDSNKLTIGTPKPPNPILAAFIVAFILVVGVALAIQVGNASKPGNTSKTGATASAQPVGVTTGGGIVANTTPAKAGAPTLDLYEDFQCPTCGSLEKAMGPAIAAMADAGDIKLVVHTLSFLDDNLRNDSSSRAANAVACASDAGQFLDYHAAVFAGQPAQEGAGYSEAQLTAFAHTAGISGTALTTWRQCATSGQHAVYVADTQTNAEKAGVNSTPTVQLNGKDITSTLTTTEALAASIRAATK